MTADDRFCDECGVVLSLHGFPDEPDPAERGCEGAQIKEQVLRVFGLSHQWL